MESFNIISNVNFGSNLRPLILYSFYFNFIFKTK